MSQQQSYLPFLITWRTNAPHTSVSGTLRTITATSHINGRTNILHRNQSQHQANHMTIVWYTSKFTLSPTAHRKACQGAVVVKQDSGRQCGHNISESRAVSTSWCCDIIKWGNNHNSVHLPLLSVDKQLASQRCRQLCLSHKRELMEKSAKGLAVMDAH